MAWVDMCGAIAAQRHCGSTAVTAAVDELQFHAPLRVGDVVTLSARVNCAFRTSLEVEVLVQKEDRGTRARTLCVNALLTFVGVDATGTPTLVPPVHAEDAEDERRIREAQARRASRLAARKGASS